MEAAATDAGDELAVTASRRACGLWLFSALALCIWAQGVLRTVGRGPLPTGALLLLAGGLVAFALALRTCSSVPSGGNWGGTGTEGLAREDEIGLLILLIVATIAFRVYRLGSLPSGLNHDAALEAIYGLRIFQHPYTPYIVEDYGHETLFKYVLWATIQIWGTSRLAVVAASTVCAIPTILPFYLFLRSLAGNRVAVAGGFLFAFSGWHWIYARSGWRCILVPLCECLVFAGVWYGLRTRKTWPWIAAGLGIAGCLNSYAAGRVVPLMVVVPFVYLWRAGGRAAIDPYRAGMRKLMIVALAFSAPMLWFAAWNWSSIMERFRAVQAAPRMDAIRANATGALLAFNVRGAGDDFIVDVPLLEWLPAVFFLFGIVVCVRSLRRMESGFLLAALFLGLLPGVVSRPNPNRCIAALPVVYAIAGLGLVACWRLLRHVLAPRRASHPTAFVLAALLLSGQETYGRYMGDAPAEVPGTYPETLILADQLKKYVPASEVHFAVGNHPEDILRWITSPGSGPPAPAFVWHSAREKILRPLRAIDRPAAFVVDPNLYPQILQMLLRAYPEHSVESVRAPGPEQREIAQIVSVSPEGLAHRQEIPEYLDILGSPVNMFEGGLGERRGSFDGAKDLDVCPDGTVVVPDTRNDRVQAFDPQGRFLRLWGQPGDAIGSFREPHAVACAEGGEIYVLDTWNGRVQVFSPLAEFRREIHPGGDFFYGPRAIAVREQKIYVTDSGHARVSVFDPFGRPLANWGSSGDAPGQFREPVGIAVDSSGNVYVVDSGSNRIQKFSGTGHFLAAWPLEGWTGQSLKEAYLAVDEADRLYVQDPIQKAVWIFRPDGTLAGSRPAPEGTRGIAVRSGDILLTVAEKVIAIPR